MVVRPFAGMTRIRFKGFGLFGHLSPNEFGHPSEWRECASGRV